MSFSVALSKWAAWVRSSVVALEAKWPTFSVGTYPGHDPDQAHAVDFMVPAWQTAAGRKKGQALADSIAKVAFCKPRGVWYVIFWGHIWSMTRPSAGWLPYFDRNNTNPSRSHHNHVHVSFYAKKPGAVAVVPAEPKPEPKPYSEGWVPEQPWVFYLDRQEIGTKDSDSAWLLQKALGRKPYDGTYDEGLREAVKAWQRDELRDEPRYCDGILGALQAKALFNDAIAIEAHA